MTRVSKASFPDSADYWTKKVRLMLPVHVDSNIIDIIAEYGHQYCLVILYMHSVVLNTLTNIE